MSKRFKRQNWFRLKRLGIKWRRPKGRQSKLRLEKKGKGKRVKIGFAHGDGLIKGKTPVYISNLRDVEKATKENIAIIASSIGKKKYVEIVKALKEKGVEILKVRKCL